jgi:hypothetical protein
VLAGGSAATAGGGGGGGKSATACGGGGGSGSTCKLGDAGALMGTYAGNNTSGASALCGTAAGSHTRAAGSVSNGRMRLAAGAVAIGETSDGIMEPRRSSEVPSKTLRALHMSGFSSSASHSWLRGGGKCSFVSMFGKRKKNLQKFSSFFFFSEICHTFL